MQSGAPYLSVVVPIFNEEQIIDELYRRLTAALGKLGKSYEVVFVDDGSRDRTFEKLLAVHPSDKAVRVIRLSRNFGHHIAITAGMDASRGANVVLMDGDLQDQPEEIGKLLSKLEEGWDVVYGIRRVKRHPFFKRLGSRLFVLIMNRIVSGAHSINTHIFQIMRRNVLEAVGSCREQSRFVLGLVSWVGFRQTGVEVEHGERFAGQTKYSLRKTLWLAFNAITGFSYAPLRVASYLGFLTATGSALYALWIIGRKLVLNTAVTGWTSLMVALLFVSGVQLVCLGAIGEYVGRVYSQVQGRPLYVVDRVLEAGGDGRDRAH